MSPVIDQRLLSIQADPQQIRSISDFTDSLVRELSAAEGTAAKALMRELLADGLRRALDLSGAEPKRRFLEALSANIHKFPLQEQQSLARVHPVEISSEYRNLQSFVEDPAPEDEPSATLAGAGAGAAGASTGAAGTPAPAAGAATTAPPAEAPQPVAPPPGCPAMAELRRRLAALPLRPGAAAEELSARILQDEEAARAGMGADPRARRAFFGELRLNLFKFPERKQRELVEHFQELRVEVARLVATMTLEISRWLDEEKVAEQRGSMVALLSKLGALFQAVLSAPFSATFKHLGSAEKKGKEAFLLTIALCLRTCQERRFTETKEIGDQAGQLRRQFFYVEGYGELMEDWLQNRIRQFNEEEFPQRVTAVLSTSMSSVVARLQRTLRPGRWLSLTDVQLEEDIFALFLDDTFPRHVLTAVSIAGMLRKVVAHGGAEFHVYGGIVRWPPPRQAPGAALPQDPIEAALLEVLHRFPPFPPLKRSGPGTFIFGRVEVEFFLREGELVSRVARADGGPPQEAAASDFFARHGPKEFPDAAAAALQPLGQLPQGAHSTTIEPTAVALPGLQAGLAGGGSPRQLGQVVLPVAFPPQLPTCLSTAPGVQATSSGLNPPVPTAAVPYGPGSCTGPVAGPRAVPPRVVPGLPGLGAPPPPPLLAPDSGRVGDLGLSSLPRGPSSFARPLTPGDGTGLGPPVPGGGGVPSSMTLPGTGPNTTLLFPPGQPLGGARFEPYPSAHSNGSSVPAGPLLFGGVVAPALVGLAPAHLSATQPEVLAAGKFGLDDDEI